MATFYTLARRWQGQLPTFKSRRRVSMTEKTAEIM